MGNTLNRDADDTLDDIFEVGAKADEATAAEPELDEAALIEQALHSADNKMFQNIVPRELFNMFDENRDSRLDFDEFQEMLNHFGIPFKDFASIKYFSILDTKKKECLEYKDFERVLFIEDPKNFEFPLKFMPSKCVSPRNLFFLFDQDKNNAIDRDEFSHMLRFMNIEIPLYKQEYMFCEHEDRAIEALDYENFLTIWLKVVDIKRELDNRSIKFKRTTPSWMLSKRLRQIVSAEDEFEDQEKTEAEFWKKWEREKIEREQLAIRAKQQAEHLLEEAIDAAGQVYVFGTGTGDRFEGEIADINHLEFPNFDKLRDMWNARVQADKKKNRKKNVSVPETDGENTSTEEKASPFSKLRVSSNTAYLWGRGITQVACGGSVIFARSRLGQLFCWGGSQRRWKYIYDVKDGPSSDSSSTTVGKWKAGQLTARTRQLKQTTSAVLLSEKKKRAIDVFNTRYSHLAKPKMPEMSDDEKNYGLVLLGKYYDIKEALELKKHTDATSEDLELITMSFDKQRLKCSLRLRGFQVTTKPIELLEYEMMEYVMLESECEGSAFHQSMKEMDRKLREFELQRKMRDFEKLILQGTKRWKKLKALSKRIAHADIKTFQDAKDDWIANRDDMYHTNLKRAQRALEAQKSECVIEVSGITARGPGRKFLDGQSAVHSISVGSRHAVAIHQSGQLYSWGVGTFGRLGTTISKSQTDVDKPTLLASVASLKFRAVSCGFSHSAAVSSDGSLYLWGSSVSGKLGLAVPTNVECYAVVPTVISFPTGIRIRKVSCGAGHTGALTSTGALYIWGCGDGGRLGLGLGDIKLSKRHRSPKASGNVATPRLVESLASEYIADVSCGVCHTAALTAVTNGGTRGGDVYVAGSAFALGVFTPAFKCVEKLKRKPVCNISCGNSQTACVTVDGELYTFGNNRGGCSGHPAKYNSIPYPKPVICMYRKSKDISAKKPAKQSSSLPTESLVKTMREDKPFYLLDLEGLYRVEKIRIVHQSDLSKGSLFVFASEEPFNVDMGPQGFRQAKYQSQYQTFDESNGELLVWELPLRSVARYILIQIDDLGMLEIKKLSVLGSLMSEKLGPKVHSVSCGENVTIAVCRPESRREEFDRFYLNAVSADAANRIILREIGPYQDVYKKYEKGIPSKCPICTRSYVCDICALYRKYPRNKAIEGMRAKYSLDDNCDRFLDTNTVKENEDDIEDYVDEDYEEEKIKADSVGSKFRRRTMLPSAFKLRVKAAAGPGLLARLRVKARRGGNQRISAMEDLAPLTDLSLVKDAEDLSGA